VETPDHRLPLLAPMSEVAGRLSAQVGAYYLMKPFGGRGRLMGGVPGVLPAKVLVLGGGIVGYNAALIAQGMQCDVTIFERSVDRMRELDVSLGRTVLLQMSSRHAIEEALRSRPGDRRGADPVRRPRVRDAGHDEAGLGARGRGDRPGRLLETHVDHAHRSHLRGRRRVPLLRREHAGRGADHASTGRSRSQGCPRQAIADKGVSRAIAEDPALAKGVNVIDGKLTYQPVADAVGMEYTPLYQVALPA
jgi:alanine dehydrogenase